MKVRLTQGYVSGLKPKDKPYWITDAVTPNLRLYVGMSGAKTWYVGYRGENGNYKNYKLGPAGEILTVTNAREMANDFLGRVAKGEDPAKKKNDRVLLGDYLKDVYAPWVMSNRKSGKETMDMLRTSFGFLFDRHIDELNLMDMEKWRMKRLESGSKASTVNRLVAALKSALNWAMKRDLIENNPLQRMEPLSEHDSDEVIRYLSDDERARLMTALDAREERIRAERRSHNQWLAERGKPLLPLLADEFADYLKPMVIISLHTGIRQNNLFSLVWGDINFDTQVMTLRAAVTKSKKTLRLNVNKTTFSTLTAWRRQSANIAGNALVFASPVTGGKFGDVKRAWANLLKDANIENFRWHDMRHDFASQLVMKGADLNMVRELLGHSDIKMTLRYAHLAPESKLRAVELLDE